MAAVCNHLDAVTVDAPRTRGCSLITSIQPGKSWRWCYGDGITREL